MKTIALLLLLASPLAAISQTNRAKIPSAPRAPVPASAVPAHVYATLNVLSNLTVTLKKQIADVKAKTAEENKHTDLKESAGKISVRAANAEKYGRSQADAAKIAPWEKELAKIRLQEYELRRAWKIPEPTNAKRPRAN